ncbi:threonylcarbamoyl-AMP synthase [Bacillus sp. FJAT-49711]|uniref:L-threonylcarbamoyladenylate synthase n=1 Tax=Bacillus sp. FJAT-49711 TaxID=2833585 RepID=UPI001BC95155|nr:L-threonylcarbamoyladenylate synthase [Bacillus sp. FJAT-49711]MBS4218897.1 threonylcarbamoyl-AMP synthase [Bacillus sp. FJAT-49711]
MKTERWSVDKDVDKSKSYPQIEEAAALLLKNEVVAFPTETVYGLGANAKSDEAVAKIFAAKGRPADNPLIVHISSTSQLQNMVASIPEKAKKLMDHFWPGPLTIIFQKKQGAVSELVTAGLDTVAVRMPDHPVALALIEESNLPIAAPSANRSGKPSPTAAEHVANDLLGKVAGILDGGSTGVGVESTVIDCTGTTPIILRPGGVSKEEIESIINQVDADSSLKNQKLKPKSPGMKYKHYAPAAPLFLAEGEPKWLQTLINEKRNQGLKVGVMASSETASYYDADMILDSGSKNNLSEIAHSLYHALRAFDEAELDIIFSETFPETGVGAAIMNRLDKASGHNWIRQTASP